MNNSELLFNNVFEEIDIDEVEEIEAGKLEGWQCSWLAYCCIHGLVIGSSGSGWPGMNPDTNACDAYKQFC